MNLGALTSLSAALRRLARQMPADEWAELATRVQLAEQRDLMALMSLSPIQREVIFAELRRHPSRRVRLRDGTTGYYERPGRIDDCFAAALATCVQVPIADVPDPRLDERLQAGEDPGEISRSAWAQLAEWLSSRGLRAVFHADPPTDEPRWLGVVRFPGVFNDHALVMARNLVLFDPVDRSQHSRPVRGYTTAEVSHGFTFEPLNPSGEETKA